MEVVPHATSLGNVWWTPPPDCGLGSLLFVDRLQIGHVVGELVVRDFDLRLRLRAETACSQTVSMALIPGVQAELA